MKVQKQVVTTEEQDIQIEEVTILSKEEYEAAKPNIQRINGRWWLRSPGNYQLDAAIVNYDGSLNYSNVSNGSG